MQYRNATDQELWLHCRQDNISAYTELYSRFAYKLKDLAFRYVKDTFASEDLVAELLLSIWEKRRDHEIENFSAYIFTALHYKALNQLRKSPLNVVAIKTVHENIATSVHADDSMLAEELESSYRDDLSKLSPQRSKVFELSREFNMSYAEIAKEMNVSISTVEKHMVAALSHLRRNYNEKFLSIVFIAIGLS